MAATLEGIDQLIKALKKSAVDVDETKAVNKEAAELVQPNADRRASKISSRVARSGRVSGTKAAGVLRYGKKSVPWAAASHFSHFDRPQGGYMVGNLYAFRALDEETPAVVDRYAEFVDEKFTKNGL